MIKVSVLGKTTKKGVRKFTGLKGIGRKFSGNTTISKCKINLFTKRPPTFKKIFLTTTYPVYPVLC